MKGEEKTEGCNYFIDRAHDAISTWYKKNSFCQEMYSSKEQEWYMKSFFLAQKFDSSKFLSFL